MIGWEGRAGRSEGRLSTSVPVITMWIPDALVFIPAGVNRHLKFVTGAAADVSSPFLLFFDGTCTNRDMNSLDQTSFDIMFTLFMFLSFDTS